MWESYKPKIVFYKQFILIYNWIWIYNKLLYNMHYFTLANFNTQFTY